MSEDLFRYYVAQTNKRLDRIEAKIDGLTHFKVKTTAYIAAITTILNYAITYLSGK